MKVPVMPKGVEHTLNVFYFFAAKLTVKVPVMPKGVEHKKYPRFS